ncbi:Ski oncogene like protein [Argiope bruennichi]|uniref:Ski oncogene like protein n=1 Tax=Argiope bruennichi TaxID=94029 RepID=A0A8T0E7P6_ARGBR|nr:Ski oncogene like protein [Argiope bruennichi]
MTDEKFTVMETGGGSKRLMYTPHLKKVLKSYQASATKSLHGPNSVMGVWQGSESDDTASVSPPNPSCSLISDLTKEKVTSFAATTSETSSVKKPKPSTSQQVTSPVVNKDTQEYDPFIAPPPFPIQQPPIFTPADQTRCEKSETILEGETISCFNVGGEERLCLPQILNTVLRDFSLQQINCVCDTLHIYCSRCNQDQLEVLKATGILPCNAPSCGLITKTDAQRLCAALIDSNPLIVTKSPDMKPPFQVKVYHECFGECHGLYTPDLFQHPLAPCIECVECHALLSPQKFVCHVHHPKETRTCHWGFDVFKWRAYILLEIELEDEVQFQQALLEMKERFSSKRKILEETCDPAPKRVHIDNCFSYPFGMDPMLIYYYSHPHLWENAFQAYPSVITKDGKTLYIPPESFPHLIQKSMHNLRSRVALTPANVQKFMPMKVPEEQTVFTYHAHKAETVSKRPRLKKEPDHDSISCFDSEDAYSDTSFSTLSAGTEDGLVSNLDDEDEQLPSTETEFLELKKVLTDVDVDASLSTKIMSAVESLIAKYRKCLNVAVQGKKLYQMELEKLHYTQRAKVRKLREKNKILENELQKLRNSTTLITPNNEQSEGQNAKEVTPNSSSPHSPVAEKDSTITTITDSNISSKSLTDVLPSEEILALPKEVEKTVSVSSPSQPKQSPNPEAESLGK